jgi:hypothetical protein
MGFKELSSSSAEYSSNFLNSLNTFGQYSITKASCFFFLLTSVSFFSSSKYTDSPTETLFLRSFFTELTSTSKLSKSILSLNIFLYII